MKTNQHKIAIIGMSGYFPEAADLEQYYQNLCAGRDSVRPVAADRLADSRLRPDEAYQVAGVLDRVDLFDPAFFGMARHDANYLDPAHRLGLELACQAIERAGYRLSAFEGSNTGVFLGAKPQPAYYKLIDNLTDPAVLTGNLPAMAAGRIAFALNLTGPAYMIDTACSSSLVAVHEACQKLQYGEIDYALAGGISVLTDFPERNPDALGIASPDGKARAFDASASGTGVGEGGGLVLLKRYEEAVADGDSVLAVILGSAINQDGGRSNGLTAPSPVAQTQVITKAWQRAGVHPETITYVEAHGTGTKLGDPIEIQGLTDAFRTATTRRQFCAVSGVKANIGHLDNAAGIAGLIKAVLALQYRRLFPSVHFRQANPLIDFAASAVYVNAALTDWPAEAALPRRCGVSSFGLSGTNAHFVLEEAGRISTPAGADQPVRLKVSAKTPSAFRAYVQRIRAVLETEDDAWRDVIATLTTGRDDYAYRALLTAPDKASLLQQLVQLATNQPVPVAPGAAVLLLPDETIDPDVFGRLLAAEPVLANLHDSLRQEVDGLLLDERGGTLLRQLTLARFWEGLGSPTKAIIAHGTGKLVKDILTNQLSLPAALAQLPLLNREAPNHQKLRQAADSLLASDKTLVFVELGPGSALATTLQQVATLPRPVISLIDPAGTMRVAKLYQAGLAIDWAFLYPAGSYQRTAAPTYPFDRVRCWAFDPAAIPAPTVAGWFHQLTYEPVARQTVPWSNRAGRFAVFHDPATGQPIVEAIRAKGYDIIAVHLADAYARLAAGSYQINKADEADYSRLYAELTTQGITGIIYLGCATPADNEGQAPNLTAQLFLSRQFAPLLKTARTPLVFVTDRAVPAGSERMVRPEQAASAGLLRGLLSDYPQLDIRGIDIDREQTTPAQVATYVDEALTHDEPVRFVAFRGNDRYAPMLAPVMVSPTGKKIDNGTYLITGGLGQIGFDLGCSLAHRAAVRLLILGRTALPEPAHWRLVVAPGSPWPVAIRQKVEKLLTLQRLGADVDYLAVDLADDAAMAAVFGTIYAHTSQLAGVIHAAGVGIRAGEFAHKPYHEVTEILSPKLRGTCLLDRYTQPLQPGFFALFSSLNALVPQRNSADYAAANAFLDAYALSRDSARCRFVAINWPGWAMNQSGTNDNDSLLKTLRTDEGITAFYLALNQTLPSIAVANVDLQRFGANPFFNVSQPDAEPTPIAGSLVDTEAILVSALTNKTGEITGGLTIEARIEAIWKEVLKAGEIAHTDDFFMVGGHSLNGAQVASRMTKTFGIEITLDTIFDYGTIRDLAGYVRQFMAESDQPAPVRLSLTDSADGHYPVSYAQERIWFLSQFGDAHTAYNMVTAASLHGSLEVTAFEQALQHIYDRYEILRTVFRSVDGEPRQFVNAVGTTQPGWRYIDLVTQPGPTVEALVAEEYSTPFDLPTGPLIRACVVRQQPDQYVFLLTLHHLVADGWSLTILLDELIGVYESLTTSQPVSLPVLTSHYRHFVHWQRSQTGSLATEQARTFWLNDLGGELPTLELPTDKPRPAIRSYQGDTYRWSLPPELSEQVTAFAEKNGYTLFMLLRAALSTLFYRYTGQNDIVIGAPFSGRTRQEWDDQVGLFLNVVGLRTIIDDEQPISHFLRRIKAHTLQVHQHQHYPFDQLMGELGLQRDLSRSPLFDVLLVVQNHLDAQRTFTLNGACFEPYAVAETSSKYDLSFYVETGNDRIDVAVEFATDLFERATIGRMLVHMEGILATLVSQPDQPLRAVSYLTAGERKQVVDDFNQTRRDYDLSAPVHKRFENQVTKAPAAVALRYQDRAYTYADLNEQANKLAHYLINEQGVRPDELIAVLADRSDYMLIALLGILKAGGAYLPIAADLPIERIRYMLDDSGVQVLLTDQVLTAGHPLADVGASLRHVAAVQQLVQASQPITNPAVDLTTQSRMYVMYTSGSTGRPKGVELRHRSVLNFLDSMQDYFGLQPGQDFLSVTTFIFDISVLEFFLPLLTGASVTMADKETIQNPIRLAELIARVQPDFMQATPSLWQMLVDTGWVGLKTMRVLCGGEKLSRELGRHLLSRGRDLWNLYGPTETTIWSTIRNIQTPDELGTIGKPIANTQLHIIDPGGNLCGVGIFGEICIAGEGLAKGYLNRPELTATRFVANPTASDGSLMYRTGDRGRWLPNGEVEFLGRTDNQVKIHGYRIELGEIEDVLLRYRGIRQAVVTVHEPYPNDRELVAYLVADEDLLADDVRQFVGRHVAAYMVPARFRRMAAMPMTANRKIDRNALSPDKGEPLGAANQPAQQRAATDLERRIDTLVRQVIRIGSVDVTGNLFEQGMNSIRVIALHQLLTGAYPGCVDIHEIFSNPTVRQLTDLLSSRLVPALAAAIPHTEEIDF